MRFAPDLHTPVGLGVVKGTRLDGGLHEASEKPLLGSGCRFSARDPRCGAGEGAPIVVPVSSAARTVLSRFRSEEHTSELQSQSNLVCRLLPQNKKNMEQ